MQDKFNPSQQPRLGGTPTPIQSRWYDDDMLTPIGSPPPPPTQQPTWPTAHTAHSKHCGYTALPRGHTTHEQVLVSPCNREIVVASRGRTFYCNMANNLFFSLCVGLFVFGIKPPSIITANVRWRVSLFVVQLGPAHSHRRDDGASVIRRSCLNQPSRNQIRHLTFICFVIPVFPPSVFCYFRLFPTSLSQAPRPRTRPTLSQSRPKKSSE